MLANFHRDGCRGVGDRRVHDVAGTVLAGTLSGLATALDSLTLLFVGAVIAGASSPQSSPSAPS
jgi:hypothetical protein